MHNELVYHLPGMRERESARNMHAAKISDLCIEEGKEISILQ